MNLMSHYLMVKDIGKSHVCGHYHTAFKVTQELVAGQMLFGMNAGCLIDSKSYAFEYGKAFKPGVKLGCGLVLDGHPMLIPMLLDADDRWTGKL